MSVAPIHVQVMVPTVLTIKQAQLVPYVKVEPIRDWFDLEKVAAYNAAHNRFSGNGSKGDFRQLKKWAVKLGPTYPDQVIEMHFDCNNWNEVKDTRISKLTNPEYHTALYFVAGKNFNNVTGHPTGTELFMINDLIYRRLTWRSITLDRYDRKPQNEAGITWKTEDEFVYFLYKCEKVNEEPMKSNITDAIGAELLERDRPKIREEASGMILPAR